MEEWVKYQKFVLSELKRLSGQQREIILTLDKLKERTTILWVKAGLIGVVTYAMSTATMYVISKI